MSLWVVLAFGAAIAQTWRSAGQKQMKPLLGDYGASYIRFIYALPFAALWLWFWQASTDQALPATNAAFWFWTAAGGLTQIIFTIALITLFNHRNFAAGTAFSKTEVLQAAVFEALIIGVVVSLQTGIAIILGVVAIFLLSVHKSKLTGRDILASLWSSQTALGLGAGAFLGLATVSYRAATDALPAAAGDVVLRASMTGLAGTFLQTISMGAVMLLVARGELIKSLLYWRKAWTVGLAGAIATACWFIAFSSHAVAPVRAVGQVELIISMGVSVLFFRERMTRMEMGAIALLTLSIVMVLLD